MNAPIPSPKAFASAGVHAVVLSPKVLTSTTAAAADLNRFVTPSPRVVEPDATLPIGAAVWRPMR